MIRVATFLWTGGSGSCAALVTHTQVLKADQTNWCVDSLTLNKLMFLYDVDLLKLQLSPSAWGTSCLSVLLISSFFLSVFLSRSSFKTSWLLVHLFELSRLLSLSFLSLAYLALEPSSYSHPGSQSLSKGILLSLSACSALRLLHLAPLWEGGFSPQCGSRQLHFNLDLEPFQSHRPAAPLCFLHVDDSRQEICIV